MYGIICVNATKKCPVEYRLNSLDSHMLSSVALNACIGGLPNQLGLSHPCILRCQLIDMIQLCVFMIMSQYVHINVQYSASAYIIKMKG